MRKLMRLVVALVLAVIIAVIGVFYFIDGIAKAGVERGATYALGVPTTLGSAKVGLLSGEFSMSRLNVANPSGFKSPHFLHLDDGGVAVSLPSLNKDLVILQTLSLSGLDANLERRGGASNYAIILDNVKKVSGDGREKPPPKPGAGKEKRFVIREVEIRNIKVHLDLLPDGGALTRLDIPIDSIKLTDVGSESTGGKVLSEVAGDLVKAILKAVSDKGDELGIGHLLGDLNAALAQFADLPNVAAQLESEALKFVQDQLGKGVEDATKGLDEATKGLGGEIKKGIGDLLGGEKKK